MREKDYWTTREVRDLIKREFDVEYTSRHVPRILRRAGISKNAVLGFLDESSHHPNVNTARLWSFGKLRIKKNTEKREKEIAGNLGIVLVFLPPYSPDLNPIEFIWKSIKREISSMFLICKEEVKHVVEVLFHAFSSSLSFAKRWIEKFLMPMEVALG